MKRKRKSSIFEDDEYIKKENKFKEDFNERWSRTIGSEVVKKLSGFKDLNKQESNLIEIEETSNDDMSEEVDSDSEDRSKEIRLKHQPESYNKNYNPFEVIESKVKHNKNITTYLKSSQNVHDREFKMIEARPKVWFIKYIYYCLYQIIDSFT